MSELLIALAILGVIATFTIPKVLQAQQQRQYNAIGKEALAAISEAYALHQHNGQVSGSTTPDDLLGYFNYIKLQTTGSIDRPASSAGLASCQDWAPCIILANGAALYYNSGNSFGGTSNNRFIYFYLDPDPLNNNSVWNATGKSLAVHLYYNGRINDFGSCQAGDLTYVGGGDQDWCPGAGPPEWFSW